MSHAASKSLHADAIYPSTFFMATGFHGLHVIDRHRSSCRVHVRATAPPSGPTIISASRRLPGTGTSSTCPGCSCSSASTGGAASPASTARLRFRRQSRERRRRGLRAGPGCVPPDSLPTLRRGTAVAVLLVCGWPARSAGSICRGRMPATAAVFVIFFLGVMVVGLAAWVELRFVLSIWVHMALWTPLIVWRRDLGDAAAAQRRR